ncbi:hypothetical protein [Ohtaekwangia koreensis]|uniref:Chain length determinant protein n=1 Tax=Ohtaekwangia koreensis TaxID=688867 RepID=A0A1T5IHN5_9BACT|nr:hypothetical protein [Ohtaekwangia koreensis]SKC38512.1 hypothetical protein SAMN05660236_0025 [Ohtaekwangia koreensis]
MTQKTQSDEIDLMELLARVYRAIKHNLLIFTILPIAGMIFTISMAYNSDDKFSSSMMITTDLLSINEAKFIFDELEKADSIPGLSGDERKNLLALNFDVEQGEQNDKTKSVNLKVTAIVKDPKAFPSLEKEIVQYLNSVDPVIRNRRDQQIYYKQMIEKIDGEIAFMDQIKKQTDSKSMASYVDPSDLYAKTVDLFKIRTESEIKLNNIQSVHVAKGFGSLIKDAKAPKFIAAIVGFVGGLVIATLLLFIKFFNDYNRVLKIE